MGIKTTFFAASSTKSERIVSIISIAIYCFLVRHFRSFLLIIIANFVPRCVLMESQDGTSRIFATNQKWEIIRITMNNWGSRLVASASIESDVLFVTRRKTGAVFNKILIIANILLRASRQVCTTSFAWLNPELSSAGTITGTHLPRQSPEIVNFYDYFKFTLFIFVTQNDAQF